MDKILLWNLLLFFSGSQASRTWAQKNAEFAVDLYQAICLSQKNNVVFSPLGTTLALAVVHLGAKGKAQQQIRQTLKLQDPATGEEFSVLKSFFSAIAEKKEEFTFNLANALYLQEGFTVKEQYLHGNKEFFQSSVKLVDFQDAKACAKTISTWIESKTDGKIKNMFSEEDFGPLTRLVLVNAIHFKGDWKQKFRKEDTKLMNFIMKDGSAVKIPMMKAWLRAKYGYFSEPSINYQILELPYKNDDFSLIIILPEKGVNVDDMEKLLTAHHILKWSSEMEGEVVEVFLPRLTVEQKLDFKEALHSLNITEIFSRGCNLSGITDSSEVYVSQVMQKVFFEINEDGSEAAASTGVHIPMIMSLTQTQFISNHPFLFIMKYNPTESILFMGRVTNPYTQKMKRRDLDSL
ncbi:serpin I2 [Fukomys damarensis]|uniref:serpin I2 n=1 Tax=Fukomys damarensis TaxID=885580 RepID=UPI00053F5441|nr:serpin I2 [Fukomys damarensis]XP_019060487.1 serpin I2 [Fukomys damarensis]